MAKTKKKKTSENRAGESAPPPLPWRRRLVRLLSDTLLRYLSAPVSRCLRLLFLRELPWLQQNAPAILRPDFTWRRRVLVPGLLASEIPSLPLRSTRLSRWVMGKVHVVIRDFSRYYCAWFGIAYSHNIVPPFGLLLKWSDGTNLDEVQSMCAIRAAASFLHTVTLLCTTPWSMTAVSRASSIGSVRDGIPSTGKSPHQ